LYGESERQARDAVEGPDLDAALTAARAALPDGVRFEER
jgi:hypothetical protein